MALTPAALNRINRIRLEFKGELEGIKMALKRVLIESDWNLKKIGLLEEQTTETTY